MFARKSAFADVPCVTEDRTSSSSAASARSDETRRMTSTPNAVATTGDKTAAPVRAARTAARRASGTVFAHT